MILFTMLIIPTLVAVGFFIFSKHKITLQEFLMQNAAQVVLMAIIAFTSGIGATSDTEIWNGKVVGKEKVRVHCRHSYTCNCRTSCSGAGKTRSCRTICQTCYEHRNDYDWEVYTDNKETIDINTIDRQGNNEPPRWTSVKVGDPTSVEHSYENFVKAAPDTLFRKQGLVEKYKKHIPKYPTVYDYYRTDRLILVNGASVASTNEWNTKLSQINAELGKRKQININVVMVKDLPSEYFYALEQAWIGSKKNDFTVVIGVNADGIVQWSEVMAWTKNKMSEVVAKDAILNLGTIANSDDILTQIGTAIDAHYIRKPMSEFQYLKNSITPSVTTWVVAMVLGLTVSIFLGIFFMNNDETY